MCNLVLHILIFVFLPKKNDYKLSHFKNVMSDNIEKVNDNTNQYLILENELKTSSRVNQAVLGFSIIIFIFLIFKTGLYIFFIVGEEQVLIFIIIAFEFLLEFINWSMALSIAAKVNKLRKDDEIKACTNAIKSGIVKVIVLITIHFIVYILEIILLCQSDVKSTEYVEEKKDDNNGLSDRNRIINVKKKITLEKIKSENFEIKNSYKNSDKNSDKNELIKLYKELKSKNEEISELKSLNPYNLKKGEKLYSIVFLSTEYQIVNNFSLICKNTDPFTKVEQTLYDKFPSLKETDINFNIVDGIVVNRYKTLEENKIKSGDVIQLCKLNFD
jgi:hypothetical protein